MLPNHHINPSPHNLCKISLKFSSSTAITARAAHFVGIYLLFLQHLTFNRLYFVIISAHNQDNNGLFLV
ncbi:hypothetical protein Hanom_Chr01g00074941 [Helianthus anomalus]